MDKMTAGTNRPKKRGVKMEWINKTELKNAKIRKLTDCILGITLFCGMIVGCFFILSIIGG